jgi:hypothetical protein
MTAARQVRPEPDGVAAVDRGVSRVHLRHGVSRVRAGRRHTLGVLFRDATG